MVLIEFSERLAFGYWKKHYINPAEVASLSATTYGEETVVGLNGGGTILVSEKIDDVARKLEEAQRITVQVRS